MNPNPPSLRPCRTCGAPVSPDQPCAACALAQVLFEDPLTPGASVEETHEAEGTGFDATALPCRLGPLLVRREIAVGGMGAVYEAEDTRTRRTVALKLLRSLLLVSDGDKERFRLEAEAAARLDHPHIVPIYEVGEHRRQPYFTMKLMEGGTLAARLQKGPLPPREAAGLLSKVAHAVHHAHQRGVLHRDLKPGNVLFDARGEPHLTDFGLAKLVHSDSSLTLSSAHLGTPQYMSPEQAAGRVREISTASDVWALGVMFYQMLAGEVPFAGDNHLEVFRRIQEEEPSSIADTMVRKKGGDPTRSSLRKSRLLSLIPADLETLCLRCLEKDPNRRLASAGDLADELDRWLRGEPILSRPVTPVERAIKWVRRNRRLSVVGAALLLALLAGFLTSTTLWRRAESARGLAETNAVQAQASAVAARTAEQQALDNAYFSTIAHALSARQQGDFGHAQRLLAGLDPSRRGFEWRLLQWLSRGDELRRVSFSNAEPRSVAWEPNRQRFGVLTADRTLHWINPANGSEEHGATVPDPSRLQQKEVMDRGFHQLAFAPDGQHFICSDGDMLIIAETDSGKLLFSEVARHIAGIWLDDRRVVFAGNTVWGGTSRGPGSLWDLSTGQVKALPGKIYAPLTISEDRQTLAWSRDSPEGVSIEILPTTNLWEVASQSRKPDLIIKPEHSSPALLSFSDDGEHLAAATARQIGQPRKVSVFSLFSGEPVFTHDVGALIHAVAFNPGEPLVTIATDDAPLRRFRFLQPLPETRAYDDDTFPELAQPVPASGPKSPPANLLSRSAFEGQVEFLLGHGERIHGLAFPSRLGGLASVSDDGTLRQWPDAPDAPAHRVGGVWTWNYWEHPTMSADGRFALYRADTNRSWLWDRQTGRRTPLPESHHPLAVRRDGGAVTRDFDTGDIFGWSPDSENGPRELWRVRGIPSHPGYGMVVRGVLSRDERILAGLIPGKLLVVNLENHTTSGTGDQRMLYGASGVNCMDLSPDARLIAVTGFIGRRARLYRTENLNGGFTSVGDAADYDTAVAFHPDGRRLFVGNEDGHVRVFDVNTHQELASESWRAQTGSVTGLAVSNDGKIIATSGDRTLRFWDAMPSSGELRRERLRMNVPAPRNWMRFSSDDKVFMHIAPGHALEAWEAP